MSVQPVEQPALSATEARALTDRIRQTLSVGHDLIIKAFAGRAWIVLGYASWDAYCAGEFSDARMIRMDREQRREIVAEMRQAGMPTRAIGQSLGVSHRTVVTDTADLESSAPPVVQGLDGKRYENLPTRRARPAPETAMTANTTTGEITDKKPRNASAEQRIIQIRTLAEKSMSSGQIGDRIGVSAEWVRKVARDNGVEIPADRVRSDDPRHVANPAHVPPSLLWETGYPRRRWRRCRVDEWVRDVRPTLG